MAARKKTAPARKKKAPARKRAEPATKARAKPRALPNDDAWRKLVETSGERDGRKALGTEARPADYDWAFIQAGSGAVRDAGTRQCHGRPAR